MIVFNKNATHNNIHRLREKCTDKSKRLISIPKSKVVRRGRALKKITKVNKRFLKALGFKI